MGLQRSSPLRDEQAAATRRRILASAAELFTREGYAATSVAAVARAAGVSAQTICNAFGSKPALLKAAYDVTLAGDDADVPLAQRPEARAVHELIDPAALLRRRCSGRMPPSAAPSWSAWPRSNCRSRAVPRPGIRTSSPSPRRRTPSGWTAP
ncbi:MAG: TetR family transcriptional regulator [Tetrasphaera sp.]